MHDIAITNETNADQSRLTVQLHRSALRTIIHVTDVTGMQLPNEIRIRLVTPGGMVAASRSHMRRFVQGVTVPPGANPIPFNISRAIGPAMANMFHLAWPVIGGQTIVGPTGQPEILICPRSLRQMGVTPHTLDAITAHEITHVAQLHHSPTFVTRAFQHMLTETQTRRALSALLEGHATHAHLSITDLIHGEPILSVACQPTPRAVITKRVLEAVPFFKNSKDYTEGAKFIGHLYRNGGKELVKSLWDDTSLIPLPGEVTNPTAWEKRTADIRSQAMH